MFHLIKKCLRSHSHSTNFESQNSHSTNANFAHLCRITSVELPLLVIANVIFMLLTTAFISLLFIPL